MSAISTHVLDTALGKPAARVPVRLEEVGPSAAGWVSTEIAAAHTDDDGRIKAFGLDEVPAGTYRLVFDTAAYYRTQQPGATPFFPEVTITFTVHDQARNYHVPLLLNPFGYSTYRGS